MIPAASLNVLSLPIPLQATETWSYDQLSNPHTPRVLSHFATDRGSNLTLAPILNDGIRPAFAYLKMVIRETANSVANSSAVKARPVASIWSARVSVSIASPSPASSQAKSND
jgi:hypothetical protein